MARQCDDSLLKMWRRRDELQNPVTRFGLTAIHQVLASEVGQMRRDRGRFRRSDELVDERGVQSAVATRLQVSLQHLRELIELKLAAGTTGNRDGRGECLS